jgi:hypothetical protein
MAPPVLFDFQLSLSETEQWYWPGPHGGGNATVKYRSAAEFRDIKPDGKNDGRHTHLGRKTGEIDIEVTWKADRDENGGPGPIATYVKNMFKAISPRGPNAGKAFGWVEEDADQHYVDDVTVDVLETTRTPGSQLKKATMKLSSWVKPAPAPAVTSTPTTSGPWSPTGPQATQTATFTKRTLPGFAKNPPKVTP